MTLTQELARYARSISLESSGPTVVERAKAHFADGIACMLTGHQSKPVRAAVEMLTLYGGQPLCSVAGWKGLKTDPANAAMLNALSTHFYDIDDISKAVRGHSTSVVMPVVLALGELLHISGRRALTAYLAGMETASALGRGLTPKNYDKGWALTSTLSIFGATATAGLLLGLDEKQMTDALGIAAGESGGFKANYGTLTKDICLGRVPAKAIMAAELARRGINANPEIMEGADGFSQAATRGGLDMAAVREAITGRTSDFISPGVIMKPQPACRGVHNGIDGILSLMAQHTFTAPDVRDILCKIEPIVKDADRYPCPQKPDEGKFSLSYCIAVALLRGAVVIDDFEGEAITDPAIFELMAKTREQIDTSFTDAKSGIEVVVTLNSGATHSYRGHYAKGDPNNPMTPEEMNRKFRQCAGRSLPPETVEHLKAILDRLEELDDINGLIAALL